MNNRDYLSFSKKERTGIITLIAILLIVALVPKYFIKENPPQKNLTSDELAKLNGIERERNEPKWKTLRDSNYRELRPGTKKYNKKKYNSWYAKSRQQKDFPDQFPKYIKNKKHDIVDVNTADTTDFITLPGIGSKLATRIVLFRDKLGGFYNVQQIGEVYGLKDSVFRRILPLLRCDAALVKKIEINQAGKDELKVHPYIRWNIANALIAYRDNHGAFGSAEDLAKVNNLEQDALRRIMPYLSFR